MPLKKALRKPQRLGPCKEQFLSLLNLFLSLRVELVHSIENRATNSSRARSHVQSGESTPCRPKASELCNSMSQLGAEVLSQLQPWLVPHSVQTPHAPARMTLLLPQTEQVMPMKMLPSAIVTRYDEVPPPLPFPSADVPPFPGLDG